MKVTISLYFVYRELILYIQSINLERVPIKLDRQVENSDVPKNCSIIKPNSLIDGCLDSVQGMNTAGGMALTGGWIAHAGVQAVGKKVFPGPAMAGALAIEAAGYCAYGAINAAQDNYNATCSSLPKTSGSSVDTQLIGHHSFDFHHH